MNKYQYLQQAVSVKPQIIVFVFAINDRESFEQLNKQVRVASIHSSYACSQDTPLDAQDIDRCVTIWSCCRVCNRVGSVVAVVVHMSCPYHAVDMWLSMYWDTVDSFFMCCLFCGVQVLQSMEDPERQKTIKIIVATKYV